MNDLAEKIEVSDLYNYYGCLLTKKQQEIFEYYYFEDLSIIEIASVNEITKNGVYNALKKSIKQLNKYEDLLGVKAKYHENVKMLKANKVAQEIVDLIR